MIIWKFIEDNRGLSSLFGILIPFIASVIYYFRNKKNQVIKKNDEETLRKKNLKKCLREELEDIYRTLNKKSYQLRDYGQVLIPKGKLIEGTNIEDVSLWDLEFEKINWVAMTFIQPLILEEAAKSGLFTPEDTDGFLHISRKIKLYMQNIEWLKTLIYVNPHEVPSLLINIEQTRRGIMKNIEQTFFQFNDLDASPDFIINYLEKNSWNMNKISQFQLDYF